MDSDQIRCHWPTSNHIGHANWIVRCLRFRGIGKNFRSATIGSVPWWIVWGDTTCRPLIYQRRLFACPAASFYRHGASLRICLFYSGSCNRSTYLQGNRFVQSTLGIRVDCGGWIYTHRVSFSTGKSRYHLQGRTRRNSSPGGCAT